MITLFPIDNVYPEGFSYIPNFLTHTEELSLLEEIKQHQLQAFTFQGYTANRKVASFGYDYNFDYKRAIKGKEIPKAFHFLIEKVAEELKVDSDRFEELLITEYPAGSVINWHRDAPPFDIIAGISLHADCNFRLRPHDKAKKESCSVISIPVQRRSLYVIQGASRSEWQHSISPVKQIRYSITLRTLRKIS